MGPERRAAALFAAVLGLLAGCASVDPRPAHQAVEHLTRPHTGQPLTVLTDEASQVAAADQVRQLLAEPLQAEAAVRVALLNHRGLQARLAQLGISQAELAQATSLPNPTLSVGRMRQGDERDWERNLHGNVMRLLVLPLVTQAETRRHEALQREVAMEVLALAADARRAWVQAVAAEEGVRYAAQVMEAAAASAELARRMEQAGNFNRLARAREQGFQAEAALALARAEQRQRATRERLTRLLGLWGEQTAFRLPARLPDLPAAPREQPDIERQALAQRLDVQAARLAAEQTARNLGLTRATRFVNVLELGLADVAVTDQGVRQPGARGWEVTLELPLFDAGQARVARAEALYRQALHRAADVAIQARSEVREAYLNYRSAWDIARHHRDELVPLKRRIGEEQLLRYNGMLIGVFELLADARAQVIAVQAAIDALRDFWLAQSDLEQAMVGRAMLTLPVVAVPTAPSGAADPH